MKIAQLIVAIVLINCIDISAKMQDDESWEKIEQYIKLAKEFFTTVHKPRIENNMNYIKTLKSGDCIGVYKNQADVKYINFQTIPVFITMMNGFLEASKNPEVLKLLLENLYEPIKNAEYLSYDKNNNKVKVKIDDKVQFLEILEVGRCL